MISEFEDFMSVGFEEAVEIIGATVARIRGANISGILSELSADEQLGIGGAVPNVKSQFMFAVRSFSPALRTGEPITIADTAYRIGLIERDQTTITLYLADPNE